MFVSVCACVKATGLEQSSWDGDICRTERVKHTQSSPHGYSRGFLLKSIAGACVWCPRGTIYRIFSGRQRAGGFLHRWGTVTSWPRSWKPCLTDRGIIRVIIMMRGGNACMSRMAGEGRIKANLLYAGFSCHGNFHYLALWKGRARERGGGGGVEREDGAGQEKKGKESSRKREKRKMSWGKGDRESKTSGERRERKR